MKKQSLRLVALAILLLICFGVSYYLLFVTKASANYADKKLSTERIAILTAPELSTIKITFQAASAASPVDWIKDYGLAYGEKPGVFQLSKLSYGWKSRKDSTPLDLSQNSRSRENPDDVLLEGLVHMQANNIPWWRGPFKGVKKEGFWEIKVLNGTYDVVVTVGDGAVGKSIEKDCINIERKKVIHNFVPYGKVGNIGRFKTVKTRVTVNDGALTVNADGGENTKINNIQITPVKMFPYLYADIANPNLLITKQDTSVHLLNVNLNNSGNENVDYKLHLEYPGNNAKWLHLIADHKKTGNNLVFDYSGSRNLAPGYYFVKIGLSATGFNSQELEVKLRVVDASKPYVVASSPINGSSNVSIATSSIAANNLAVPIIKGFKGGIDNNTITDKDVKLLKEVNGEYYEVKGVVQGTGGGDAISFSPRGALDPNTHYKFLIADNVKSYSGLPIERFESDFTTGTIPVDSGKAYHVQFIKKPIPGTQRKNYTTLTFGPDGRFYALRMDGAIERYDVNHEDGSLTGQKIITTLKDRYGERTAIGFVFDPASTPQNLIAWVTHSSGGLASAPQFDGNISRLSGTDLSDEQLMVTKLPRSTRDHMINSLVFGPDGALYMGQGSNSSAGAFDKGWQRDETLLAGAILRLNPKKLKTIKLPLDVETTSNQKVINEAPSNDIKMSDGTYNPYSTNSPLTIYASGIRNAYDLIWHSNGQLYVPANGSGGGGNSPASTRHTRRPDGTFYDGPEIPATNGVEVQRDWLFRVNPDKGVGYYGHPNPLRGEYVVNRGHIDNPLYDSNIKPDKNYRGAAFDFGLNHSPNGIIEYKSNSFNGTLKGKLLVCRFSGGGDIMVLEPGSMVKKAGLKPADNDHIYDIVNNARGSGNLGLTGMSEFANPLDITEDTTTGNLYVSEFNWNNNPNLVSQITLLKVDEQKSKEYAQIKEKKSKPIH